MKNKSNLNHLKAPEITEKELPKHIILCSECFLMSCHMQPTANLYVTKIVSNSCVSCISSFNKSS